MHSGAVTNIYPVTVHLRGRGHAIEDDASMTFAWAGGLERGQGHYYRVQAPGLLVEYDNTQNDANHIHTVWRDPERDFGRDILAEHYAGSH